LCTSANTQAQRKRRRSLPSYALHSARGWESPGIESGTNESTANRSGSGGGVNLWDMLGRAAETFLANHPAMVAARTAAGAHALAVTPATPARSMPGRPTAFQSIPPFPPQVSPLHPPWAPRLSTPSRLRVPLRLGYAGHARCRRLSEARQLTSRLGLVVRDLERGAVANPGNLVFDVTSRRL
jgi:hypothetical protein